MWGWKKLESTNKNNQEVNKKMIAGQTNVCVNGKSEEHA